MLGFQKVWKPVTDSYAVANTNMEVSLVRVPVIIVRFVKSTQLGIFKVHLLKSIYPCPNKHIHISLYSKRLSMPTGQESNVLMS